MLTSPAIEAKTHALIDSQGVRHGFFTRRGGVSSGLYEGLNVGSGSNDDAAAVAENRRRAAVHMNSECGTVVTPWQVHSPDAVIVDAPFRGEKPKTDAIVTATPSLVIGVVTADCGPILFSDAKAGVIGAAHAGWKGAMDGVLENTIAAMEKIGARRADIRAVLGPSISQRNYEVGPEFVSAFLAKDSGFKRFFIPSQRPDHSMFDLRAFTLRKLEQAGVACAMTRDCTYADEENFYSYRRATHRKEADYGRQLSAISIRSA
jgi:polyphenol oxidase